MERKRKELEEQLKREQNANGMLEQDKRMIEKELQEKVNKVDELQQQLVNMKKELAQSGARNKRPPASGTQMSKEEQVALSQTERTRVLVT